MKKILVVDNHPVMLKFMSNLLEKEGYQVLTAVDGISALDILKACTPDFMFIDLVMPNIDGKKLCRIIRSMPKLKDVYLIILTAIAVEEKLDFFTFGANACIAKGPFSSMSKHVLDLLDKLEKRPANYPEEEIIGFKDINARRIIEELLSSKRHFEIILENISEGILELNSEGKIVNANSTAVLFCGIAEEDLLASDFSGLFHGSQWQRVRELWDLIDEGPQKIPEDSPVIQNGRQVLFNMLPIKDGEEKSVIVIINDVSERKRIENQLQRAKKVEAIGALAGGVAHDLNNILSGLVSYPELLLMDLAEESPLRKPILTIQKSGEKAAMIVQDLLTLASQGVDTARVMNINHTVSEYLKSVEYEKLKSYHPHIKLETELEADLLNIMGSPVHLSRIVMNLVSNAIEAMPDGGKINIATENRYVDRPIKGYDDVVEGDYVVLTVTDTGVGISPEDMDKIFEPFYTKKVMGRSGTGLGMAIVYGTLKDHHGYINVLDNEGKGTTFALYFPVIGEELARENTVMPIQNYIGNGESILIVDDVEEQREIASAILKKLGYSVSSVSSGEEAVEYLKNSSVDLLLLDMIMDPGIDGLETYKRILELHPEQKAIIASGFSETKRVKEVQKKGAGQYIKKPYTLEKIGLAIRAELGG